jgi:hypothetical protein
MKVFFCDWEELQAKHLLRTQALTFTLPLVPPRLNGALPLNTPSFSSHSGPHHFFGVKR